MGYTENLRKIIGHQPVILNGCCAVLVNSDGLILLQQRNEPAQRWGLPGGLMELGESTVATVIREVHEECGLNLTPSSLHLLNVYSGSGHHVVAPNGDEFENVVIAYYAINVTGTPHIADDESLQYQWFTAETLPANIVGAHREVLTDYLALTSK